MRDLALEKKVAGFSDAHLRRNDAAPKMGHRTLRVIQQGAAVRLYNFAMARKSLPLTLSALVLIPLFFPQRSAAWGADGHRLINRLAALNLPKDVPEFLRTIDGADTLEYLGPEPDRLNHKAEAELYDAEAPDHFIDMEYADMLGTLPRRRRDYVKAVDALAVQHPELKLTAAMVGFNPYQTEEVYQRLVVAFRQYRKLTAAHAKTAPDEKVIEFYAGWLGHYVADGSQPLHATYQYNGWTGANPNGYTTAHSTHSKFESTFVTANVSGAEVAALVDKAAPRAFGDEWTEYMKYLHHTATFVEKTYQLEKGGAFDGDGTAEGKTFTEERLAAGAIELRDMIYTAWLRSGDPVEEYKGPA